MERERRRAGRREAPDRAGAPRNEARNAGSREEKIWRTQDKLREKKDFFARDTAALLLDCATAHSVELALIASHGSQSVRVSKVATMLGAGRNTFAVVPRITPSVLWSPGPRRYVQAPLPVGDRGSGSDDARGGAKRRIAREPPREANRGTKCRVKICGKREKKSFFREGHRRVALGLRSSAQR